MDTDAGERRLLKIAFRRVSGQGFFGERFMGLFGHLRFRFQEKTDQCIKVVMKPQMSAPPASSRVAADPVTVS